MGMGCGGGQIKPRLYVTWTRPFGLFRALARHNSTISCLGSKLSALESSQRRYPRPTASPTEPRVSIEYLYTISSGRLFPEYYVLSGVPQSATTEEIRAAYKRENLRYVSFLMSSIRILAYSIHHHNVLIRLVA